MTILMIARQQLDNMEQFYVEEKGIQHRTNGLQKSVDINYDKIYRQQLKRVSIKRDTATAKLNQTISATDTYMSEYSTYTNWRERHNAQPRQLRIH